MSDRGFARKWFLTQRKNNNWVEVERELYRMNRNRKRFGGLDSQDQEFLEGITDALKELVGE